MGILDLFKKKTSLKPGQRCTRSGQWSWSRFPFDQVTSNKGDPMPPPPPANRHQPGGQWNLTDRTRTRHG